VIQGAFQRTVLDFLLLCSPLDRMGTLVDAIGLSYFVNAPYISEMIRGSSLSVKFFVIAWVQPTLHIVSKCREATENEAYTPRLRIAIYMSR